MYELVIVGAGPIGLFAGFYSGMRGLKTLILETSNNHGGQPLIYKEKLIHDIPGIKSIKAVDLIDSIYKQYETFKDVIPIIYNSKITKIEEENGIYKLFYNEEVITTKTILLCYGNGNLAPRKLEIENVNKCPNILYKIENINLYRNKDIVVLGGGDSAIDIANMLTPISKSLTLIHRRDEFRAHEESVNKLKASKAKILTSFNVDNLFIKDDKNSLLISNNLKEEKAVNFDYCFVNYGLLPSSNIFSNYLEVDVEGVKVRSDMATSKTGIYGAGNCVSYLGKVRTLAVGFGEVITAISAIHQYLYPTKNPTFFSSTSYKK